MTVANMLQTVDRHLPIDLVGGNVKFEVIITWLKAELEAANEYVVAGPFPADMVMDGWSFRVASEELEAGGPTMEVILGFGDADGVIDTTLFTDAGTEWDGVVNLDWEQLDDLAVGSTMTSAHYDIGGLYLIFEIGTVAGTGGANGVTTAISFEYGRGISDSRTAT